MSPTATKAKPKTKDVLVDLAEREAKINEAKEEMSRLGREYSEATATYRELAEQRGRLIRDDPSLVDHLGVAVGDNAVAEVDKKLLTVNVGDLEAQYRHAQKIHDRLVQGFGDWRTSRRDDLADALQPGAEALCAELQAQIDKAHAKAVTYLGCIQRWEHLTGRRSPALDHAAALTRDLKKTVPGVETPNTLGGIGTVEVDR